MSSDLKEEKSSVWSKEFPKRAGVYFLRWPDGRENVADIVESDGCMVVYESGHDVPEAEYVYAGTEWLGPVTVSDTEELFKLRTAAVSMVIPYEALLLDAESRKWIAPEVWTAIRTAVAQLKKALGKE